MCSAHDADIQEAAGEEAVAKVTHADHEHGEIRRDESYAEKVWAEDGWKGVLEELRLERLKCVNEGILHA